MLNVNLGDYLKQVLEAIPKGAFLTVKSDNHLNTMTIGWGSFGYLWGKEIIMVMVRKSRYTYSIIEKTDYFSVSIPFHSNLRKELSYCGSYSGRDVDKFKECNLETIPGKIIDTPIIKGCNLHLECKIKFKQDIDQRFLVPDYREKWYPEGDFHTLYYGELLACYLDETIKDGRGSI